MLRECLGEVRDGKGERFRDEAFDLNFVGGGGEVRNAAVVAVVGCGG